MVRRALLVVPLVFFLWAAPAHADTYGNVLPTTIKRTPSTTPAKVASTSRTQGSANDQRGDPGGGLARTGSDNAVPLGQTAIVLLGGGTLLVLVGRRRRVRQLAI